MNNHSKFEVALMERLTDFRLHEENLKRYSKAILDLNQNDVTIERIWVRGQPPIDELFRTVGLKSRISVKNIHKLNEILKLKDIYSVKVFPVGIIEPEFLDVQFELGENLMNR